MIDRTQTATRSEPAWRRVLLDPGNRMLGRLRRAVRRGLRAMALRPGRRAEAESRREELAVRFLRGDGIEIGALHRPLHVSRAARVRYVDIMTREQLLATHASTIVCNPATAGDRATAGNPAIVCNPESVVVTDVLDDCERLQSFEAEAVDFVIANHILEHTEDPIGTLEQFMRVLRPGGILFVTLPDARHTFDSLRARTTVEHLVRDHRDGPEVSREEHYREWALVECLPPERIADRVADFARDGTRHHFHVWELEGFLDLLHTLDLPARLELAQAVAEEFSVVLRKS
jgi:SAM-dependent methyltransferase